MVQRITAIENFLRDNTHPDLAALYTPAMEVQVNVAQDNGDVIAGEYMGKKWRGYTDGITTWKSFRIPYNAWSEPVYEDKELRFSLAEHAEGIGLTGWDWVNRQSLWVAFDFDALIGHSDKHTSKLSFDELEAVKESAYNIPWVTVRKSTSGSGLHLYVFLDPVHTETHLEHSSLARAILSYMVTYTGFDFKSRVDICGGNMWVWHRKMRGTDGLTLLKQGSILTDIPPNWRDHVPVIQGRATKVKNEDRNWLNEDKETFEQLTGAHKHVRLDKVHLSLLEWLREQKKCFWWDSDRHMLVAHVCDLAEAHNELGYKGTFQTTSPGTNLNEPNCFAYPMRNGAWAVRRYGRGTREHATWVTDNAGFTLCYLNKQPDLRMAALANNGVEDEKGRFIFPYATDLEQAAQQLGADIVLPDYMSGRQNSILKQHKDGRLLIEIPKENNDHYDHMLGWVAGDKKWTRLVEIHKIEAEQDQPVDTYDDLIRHVVDEEGRWSGWYVYANNRWNLESLQIVKHLLAGKGLNTKDVNGLLAYHIQRPWVLVIKPFQPEYPGDREWNRDAPRFKVQPSTSDNLHYPTWQSMLNHIGKSLDEHVRRTTWAQRNGITTGADYLKCWIASMIQYPQEPLPYLFIYGAKQATGKSTFHESLELLFHPGYENAGNALTNSNNFNGELAKAVLCVVEEKDLHKSRVAYNRIKEWVTSIYLPIHYKNQTPYYIRNTTHWVQCANPREDCPIFPGDTRITMIHVPGPPEVLIPKHILRKKLEKEVPDFLAACLRLELPEPVDRMNIPVIETPDKVTAADLNKTELERFLEEEVYNIPGHYVTVGDFYARFNAWLDPVNRSQWSKIKVAAGMPPDFPKGRPHGSTSQAWGNMTFNKDAEPGPPYYVKDNMLIQKEEK